MTSPSTTPAPRLFGLKRDRLCEAMALAEGYLVRDEHGKLIVNPQTRPRVPLPVRCNNPGDLEAGDIGHGTTQGKTNFPTPAAGWARLRGQVTLILTGRSHAGYKLSDKFLEFADRYSGHDHPETWAYTAAKHCGMDPTNTLSQYLTAPVFLEPEFAIPEAPALPTQTPAPEELL